MSKKTDNVYDPPKMELLEIMVEQAVMDASVLDWDGGYGPDTYDDFEFGERL